MIDDGNSGDMIDLSGNVDDNNNRDDCDNSIQSTRMEL